MSVDSHTSTHFVLKGVASLPVHNIWLSGGEETVCKRLKTNMRCAMLSGCCFDELPRITLRVAFFGTCFCLAIKGSKMLWDPVLLGSPVIGTL